MYIYNEIKYKSKKKKLLNLVKNDKKFYDFHFIWANRFFFFFFFFITESKQIE